MILTGAIWCKPVRVPTMPSKGQHSAVNFTSVQAPVSSKHAHSSDGKVRSARHGITRSTSAAAAAWSSSHTSNKYRCQTRMGTVVHIGSHPHTAWISSARRWQPLLPRYSAATRREARNAFETTARDAVLKLQRKRWLSTCTTARSKTSSCKCVRRASRRKTAMRSCPSGIVSTSSSPGRTPASKARPPLRTVRTTRPLLSCSVASNTTSSKRSPVESEYATSTRWSYSALSSQSRWSGECKTTMRSHSLMFAGCVGSTSAKLKPIGLGTTQ
mmetsp:Transcript_35272/g.101895  ORF Transcript_35272/g.101895 Transcript_35272/m.101895 type:complete len:272 (-) Transcript_35272:580-1395(-)